MCKIKSSLYAGKPTGSITVDLKEMEIEIILNNGESISVPSIYSSLKTLWRYQEPLMKYDFPVKCETVHDLIISKLWTLIIISK